ncbi:MAG: SlyX family protein [Gammaproteobacteria bacterium]
MSDNNLHDRVDALEVRLMHLEAALDEVTRTLLAQEAQLRQQADTLRRLESLVKGLADASINDPHKEPPPPHY